LIENQHLWFINVKKWGQDNSHLFLYAYISSHRKQYKTNFQRKTRGQDEVAVAGEILFFPQP